MTLLKSKSEFYCLKIFLLYRPVDLLKLLVRNNKGTH